MADLRATPYANPLTGLSNDVIQGLLGYMKDKQRTQQMQGLASLLESTGIPKTVERAAYAESPTGLLNALTNVNRANVPLLKPETADALMNVAPFAAPATRAMMQATKGLPVGASIKNVGEELIYHGTSPKAAKAIEKSGFDVTKSADGTIWFTSNPNIGEVAATGKGAVVKRFLNEKKMKLGGWDETDKYSTDELIQKGFDGLKLKDSETGEITYQIFNPEKLSVNKSYSYPQQEALDLAQQRAALPKEQYGLGLPADNTPEMRAAAMNNMEKRGFHETEGKNIEQGLLDFDTRRVGAAASDEQTPYAMFIKPHGSSIGIAKDQPAQMPLYVKSNLTDENVLQAFGDRAELQQYLNQFPDIRDATKAVRDLDNQMAKYMDEMTKKSDDLYAQGKIEESDKLLNAMANDSPLMKQFDERLNELSAIAKEKITQHFQEQGIGTVGLTNDQGAFGRKTITEMVLNPAENVRSAFAVFDPWRRTAAIAAATGVAAPNLMAQEVDYSLLPEQKKKEILSLLE
jgi:hypothetical protein